MSRDLILIALSLMTWGLGEGMFYFFNPIHLQRDLGAEPASIGGILGLVTFFSMLAYLPAGYLSDRFGRRPLIRIAWLIGCLSTLLMAVGKTLPAFTVGMALYFTTAFVTVPLNSYTTHARGRLSVGRAITLISSSFSLGAILGPLIGGYIGNRWGLQTNYWIAFFIFLVSTVIIFFIQPQPVEEIHTAGRFGGLREMLSNRRYLLFLLMLLFIGFTMLLPQHLAQNYLEHVRELNLQQVGLLIGLRSLGVVLLNLSIGRLNARVGVLIAQICMLLFSLLLWFGSGLPAYALAYLLLGSFITARGLSTAQGRVLANPVHIGIAYGLIDATFALAGILSAPLAGIIFERSPSAVFAIGAFLIAAGFIVNLFFSPLKRRDIDAFEQAAAQSIIP